MTQQPFLTRLMRIIYLAFVLIAASVICGYGGLQHGIDIQRQATANINLSGQQRMLSQRIALTSMRLVTATSAEQHAILRVELQAHIRRMLQQHATLTVDCPDLVLALCGPDLHDLYFAGPVPLDTAVREYLGHAQSLSQAEYETLSLANADFVALQESEASLLAALGDVVSQREQASIGLIEQQHQLEAFAFIFALVVVILSAFLIVRPIERRVAQVFKEANRLQQQLAAALDTVGESILMLDQHGSVRLANREANILFGGDVLGVPIATLVPGFAALAPTSTRLSTSGMRLDKAALALELTATPTNIDNDLHTTLALHDVSQRQQLEHAQRETELVYQTLVGSLVEGVVLQQADGAIIACNASAERILGLTADQLHGVTSIDPGLQAIHEDGSPFPGDTHPAMVALRTGKPQLAVIMGIMRPSGELNWISINAQPIIYPDTTTPHAVVCSFFDITEQRRFAQHISFQKTLLECQTEASPDGILVVSPMRHWLYANERFAAMWNLDDSTMAAATDSAGIPAMMAQTQDAEQSLAEMEGLYTNGDASGHGQIALKDGRVFDRYSAPVRDANGMYYGRVWYFRDVTERELADQAKREFVSVVSHELRTPLTSIRGALSIVASGSVGALPERAHGMLEIAHKNSERLIRLVNDILDIEKIESDVMPFVMTPLALSPLIAHTVEANQAFAQQFGVSITVAPLANDVWVLADSDRLIQVFANLLSNAVKFSPQGGIVQVECSTNGRTVFVRVIDHGSGIPPAFQKQVFDKFAQADSSDTRRHDGSGLGLSITQAIVQRHQGRISFTTSANGTVFAVELPHASAPLACAPAASATVAHTISTMPVFEQRARVLHVEDDIDLVRVTTSLLRDLADVTSSQTVAQAIRLLSDEQFDVVLLDLHLYDGSGLDILPMLSTITPPPPVVIFSTNDVVLPNNDVIVARLVKSRTSNQELVRLVRELTKEQRARIGMLTN